MSKKRDRVEMKASILSTFHYFAFQYHIAADNGFANGEMEAGVSVCSANFLLESGVKYGWINLLQPPPPSSKKVNVIMCTTVAQLVMQPSLPSSHWMSLFLLFYLPWNYS